MIQSHSALLLGKFEAYSVLHNMYLWMRVGKKNSRIFSIVSPPRIDQCVGGDSPPRIEHCNTAKLVSYANSGPRIPRYPS